MMGYTDRHFRYLLRLISRCVRLYTEMVTSAALLHCGESRILRFDPAEHPLALQLGGADPSDLARCARMGEAAGFDEINLNVGCPSDRVQNARFGACLMAEPERVADCVSAMRAAVRIPVTVKTRTGIDDLDSYSCLHTFTNAVADAGCRTLIIHARKAWLRGLSPRENRSAPPLCYETVYRLKRDFPHLNVVINGGIESIMDVRRHLRFVEGAMLGRAICRDPYVLAAADSDIFNAPGTAPARQEILARYMDYAEAQLAAGVSLHRLTRHVLDLFRGQAGARAFRRYLSENATRRGAGLEVIDRAARLLQAA
jgi:tRNA-dihydrouridine synthase A